MISGSGIYIEIYLILDIYVVCAYMYNVTTLYNVHVYM